MSRANTVCKRPHSMPYLTGPPCRSVMGGVTVLLGGTFFQLTCLCTSVLDGRAPEGEVEAGPGAAVPYRVAYRVPYMAIWPYTLN